MSADPTGETERDSALPRPIARFVPGLEALMHYDRSWLRSDVVAGLSIAAVALPVGIALAEVTRVPAVFGIYAATSTQVAESGPTITIREEPNSA